ncbi:MAG TPA: hypothetical protein VHC98_03695 [Candidatus Saccharimonadales bacterium]|nr:hypothetical protein [Candidatus Saccharimonadales bacterium]
MEQSPYKLMRDLEAAIARVLAGVDSASLDPGPAKTVRLLKGQLVDARLDVRDYELAETRAEQGRLAADGKKRLAAVRQSLLKAAEQDIFSAVQVAQFSAQLDRLAAFIA